jgi:hypothetical protein
MSATKSIGQTVLTAFWVMFWIASAGMIWHAIHTDNLNDAKRAEETTAQWNAWVAWRDANCHITERMIGLSETSGKFHQNDNATVYDCGGVKYVVADSVEYAAKSKSLEYSQIPKLFDKK